MREYRNLEEKAFKKTTAVHKPYLRDTCVWKEEQNRHCGWRSIRRRLVRKNSER